MNTYGAVKLTDDEEQFFYFKCGIKYPLTYATGTGTGTDGKPWGGE